MSDSDEQNKKSFHQIIRETSPIAFRYIILIIVFLIIDLYSYIDSTKFIIYIVLFITIFFAGLFLYWDLVGSNLLMPLFSSNYSSNILDNEGIFIKIFVGVLFLTLLLQVASIAIMISVFDYGREQTNSFYTSKLTKYNYDLLELYEKNMFWYITFSTFFAFVMAVSYMKEGRIKNMVVNIGCMIPIMILLYTSIYGTILAVQFLNVRKFKRALYE